MKVKINKDKKTKTYKVIESWSDVTLESWLRLIDFNKEGKSKEALNTIAELSNIPKKLINVLSIKDIAIIMGEISRIQSKENTELKKIIKVEGIEYGFHPDLDEITLGEYADIETFVKLGIDKHLPELMAILFRPVVEKKNDIYVIEAYDGKIKIRAEIMKKMPAEQVQAALVFFWSFVNALLKTLPLCLTEQMKETKTQLHQKASQKNGVGLV